MFAVVSGSGWSNVHFGFACLLFVCLIRCATKITHLSRLVLCFSLHKFYIRILFDGKENGMVNVNDLSGQILLLVLNLSLFQCLRFPEFYRKSNLTVTFWIESLPNKAFRYRQVALVKYLPHDNYLYIIGRSSPPRLFLKISQY